MLINTEQWRAGAGTFNGRIFFSTTKRVYCDPINICKSFFNFFYSLFLSILVLKTADVELNPGTNKKPHSYFSCCHWNLNSLPNDSYCKVATLKPHNRTINMILYVLVKLFLILHLHQLTKFS